MGPRHLEQGWHSGATVGVFAAAAASARALQLSQDQTIHALGLAGTQASGLMAAQFGSMVKRMHAGKAAQSGLYAGLLAQRGFTGILDVFETQYGGFCTTFSASQDLFDLDRLTRGLGENFELMRVSVKLYSCVASNHTTLDAIRMLRAERPFGPDDVERMVVHASKATVEHVGWTYKPEGVTSAQLNLSFCVATLLLEGACFVDQFSEDAIFDSQRIALAGRVECVEDESITSLGADMRHMVRVEVHLQDGSVLSATVEKAQGSEDVFPADEVIVSKFRSLARKALSEDQADRLAETVLRLEDCPDASELARLMVPATDWTTSSLS
jgi:2-methylcitrate dehydratase PrpD